VAKTNFARCGSSEGEQALPIGFRLNIRTLVGVGLALVVGVAACGSSVLGHSATAAANVFLDGQGHLVIEARRASADLNC